MDKPSETPQQRYRRLHPDRVKAAQDRYRKKHPDRVKARWAKWYTGNKDAHLANRRAYYAANRDAIMEQTLERQRKRKYGMGTDAVALMLAAQGGTCAICPAVLKPKSAHVDHDHATGAVRGILCRPCNLGLGKFRDDPELLMNAIGYLRAHQQEETRKRMLELIAGGGTLFASDGPIEIPIEIQ